MTYKARKGRVRRVTPWSHQLEGDIWDCRRDLALLHTQILNERSAVETWQRRLGERVAYERRYRCTSQIPMLRQECAAAHTRLLELEKRLINAQVRLRFLLAEQRASERP